MSDGPWHYLDLSEHPVVRGLSVATVEAVDAYFDEIGRFLVERPGPHVLVIDARGSVYLDAPLRQRMAARLKQQAPLRNQWCRGVFVVVDSPLLRGMLRALAWLIADPLLRTAPDVDAAVAAAERLMKPAA